MYSAILSFSTFIFQVSCLYGWAPPHHPTQSKLPKALEFAEKAWKFPNPDELHPSPSNGVSVANLHDRRFPWSPDTRIVEHDQSLSCMEDGDQFYFDGHSSISLRWPTRQAFLESLPKTTLRMNVDMATIAAAEDEDCDEPYFDDTGDVLCWATVGSASMAAAHQDEGAELEQEKGEEDEECEHIYFDRIGGEDLCWATFQEVAEAAHKKMTTSHAGQEVFEEDCEDTFYDDTGDLLCWAI